MKSRNPFILIVAAYVFSKTGTQKNMRVQRLEQPLFAVPVLQTLVRCVLGVTTRKR
jgi:hypothetical protein